MLIFDRTAVNLGAEVEVRCDLIWYCDFLKKIKLVQFIIKFKLFI